MPLLKDGIAHSGVTVPSILSPANIGRYPNPLSDKTVIERQTPVSADMNRTIFDAFGRRIRDRQGPVAAGETKRVRFRRRLWPSGVSLCRGSGGTLDRMLKLHLLY